MFKRRFWAVILLLISALVGYFVYSTNWTRLVPGTETVATTTASSNYKFKLGLDLNGGIELIYKADTSGIAPMDIAGKMNSLKDLIDKRVNMFGVSEPIIAVEKVGIIGSDASEQLIVDLPGQTDIAGAIAQVGKTYVLEFKLLKKEYENATSTEGLTTAQLFESTGLTGALLTKASLEFNQTTGEPNVADRYPKIKTLFTPRLVV